MPRKSSRNPQGAGTIRQRKDGRWEARYTAGRNPGAGRQIQKSVYGATQAEVRKKLQQVCVEKDNGTFVEPSKMPLSKWLDLWLAEYTGNVKEHTQVTYETQIRVHIKPALGAMTLSTLRAHDIQSFYNRLRKTDELAPKTIKNIHGVLHRALDQAVVIGYLRSNPCMGVKLPRIEREGVKPLMDDQIGAFLAACVGNTYEHLFSVTMFTGMRQSEVMGLQWSCVDFNRGTILIDKQLVREKKRGGLYKFAPPKNDKPRKITPSPTVMILLERVKYMQKQDRLRAGSAWQNDFGLVFTDALGNHFVHNTIAHNFKRIVTSIGLPDRRFHDLRHTYAVMALQSCIDVKTVQETLGHATAAFTLDVYGHVTEQMKTDAAARMEAFIKNIN